MRLTLPIDGIKGWRMVEATAKGSRPKLQLLRLLSASSLASSPGILCQETPYKLVELLAAHPTDVHFGKWNTANRFSL
jgi:hypothetical protein